MQNVCLTNDLPVGVFSVDAGHHSGHVYVETVRGEKVLGGVVEDRTAHVHDQDERGTIVAPANYNLVLGRRLSYVVLSNREFKKSCITSYKKRL